MTLDPAGLEAAAKELWRPLHPDWPARWGWVELSAHARDRSREVAAGAVRAYLAAAVPPTGEKNPYRQAREVENDALARMTGPSPKEIGWDEGFAAGRAAATPDAAADEFTEAAWGLIASAYGGNWSDAPDDWHGAAARWRDEYVAGAIARPPAASPDDQPVMANMCEGESPDHKPGITAAATPEAPDEEGWSPGIDDPQPPALGDIDTGEGWYQT